MPDLGLHHDDARADRGEVLEQVQQHGHGDVVREVGDERGGIPGQLGDAQRVLVHDRELGVRLVERHRVRQLLGEPAVDLHGDDARAGLEEAEGEGSEARPHLDHVRAGLDARDPHDAAHRVGVDDEVLAELLGGRDAEQLGEVADLGGAEERRRGGGSGRGGCRLVAHARSAGSISAGSLAGDVTGSSSQRP